MKFNPYEELGLDPRASAEDVEKAYRERAKETHPDRGGDTAEFQRAQRAVMILRNPKKRKHYDETGDAADEKPEQHPDFHALTYIGQLIAKLCSMQQLEKVLHYDLVQQLIEGTREDAKVIRDQIAGKKQAIQRAEKLLNRFKRKGQGLNLLDDGVKFFIRSEKGGIRELERALSNIDRASKILNDFEFEKYEDPMSAMFAHLEAHEVRFIIDHRSGRNY